MAIDYRDLLKRYINHVGHSEGINYLSDVWLLKDGRSFYGPVSFTPEELDELTKLSDEP